jgi:hypothetical protein
MGATNQLKETEEYLQRAFDYQESELAAARKRFTDKARDGQPRARRAGSHQGTTAKPGQSTRAGAAAGAARG